MAQFSRRFALGVLLGGVAGHALANAPLASLRPVPRQTTTVAATRRPVANAEQLISGARLTGDVAYAVADATSGEVLESRLGNAQLPPASVTKAITALYALDTLGGGYRYKTRLYATGTVSGGRLRGDLVLAGGGDPTLDTDDLGEMVRVLKDAGVREITGRFLIYAGALPQIEQIDPGQAVQVGYNPTISGLNLNFNRVHFEWKRQGTRYDVKLDARARRFAPQVSTSRMQVADRDLPVYTFANRRGVDQWTVARRALGNGGSRWLPVRRPELYAADVFQTLARSFGVVLPKPELSRSAPKGTVLVEHRSAPLQTILRDMLKFSTNLTAEVVGLTASGSTSKSLEASARKMTAWARRNLGLSKAKFVDHSGLGGASRLNAAEMVNALVRARRTFDFASILKDIPMRDSNGNVLANHPVKVRAKTGTLNFASSLAGYMTTEDGRTMVFAIFSADVPRRESLRPADGDIPDGSVGWRKRARRLQLQLLDRWGNAYAA